MSLTSRRAALACFGALALGGLSAGLADAQVFIERAPPPAIVEVVPPAPRAGYNWVPGHYAWRYNRWVWIRGHYVLGPVAAMPAPIIETPPPAPGPRWFWVRGHYVWERGGWVWHPGHWVR